MTLADFDAALAAAVAAHPAPAAYAFVNRPDLTDAAPMATTSFTIPMGRPFPDAPGLTAQLARGLALVEKGLRAEVPAGKIVAPVRVRAAETRGLGRRVATLGGWPVEVFVNVLGPAEPGADLPEETALDPEGGVYLAARWTGAA